MVLEQAKDHCKQIIKETKKEIALIEDPQSNYDLNVDENLPDADEEKGVHIEELRDEGLI